MPTGSTVCLVHRSCRAGPVSVPTAPRNSTRPSTKRARLVSAFQFESPPQSSFASDSARRLSARATYQGSCPPRDITGARPLSPARLPTLATFRPQAFAASRRFSPRSGFEACFILEPRPGRASVQGLLPPRSRNGSSPPSAPLPFGSITLGARPRGPPVHLMSPRLRGFAPREGAFVPVRGSASPDVAPLFGFSSSRPSTSRGGAGLPVALRSWRC